MGNCGKSKLLTSTKKALHYRAECSKVALERAPHGDPAQTRRDHRFIQNDPRGRISRSLEMAKTLREHKHPSKPVGEEAIRQWREQEIGRKKYLEEVRERWLESKAEYSARARGEIAARHEILAWQEWWVARLISHGFTNGEIAQALDIEVPTVRTILSAVMRKSGVDKRTKIARWFLGH